MNTEIKDKYKIVVAGDSAVGKSAILKRYTQNSFNVDLPQTIGTDYTNKLIQVQGENLRLELWDTGGQDRFHSIVRVYFRNCAAILIVYNVTSRKTFQNVDVWARFVADNGDEGVTITLVGNQIDKLNERQVSKEEGQQKANQLNALFFETSAKDDINIKEIFEKTIKKALLNPNVKSVSKTLGCIKIQPEQPKEKAKSESQWCFGIC